MLINNRIKIWHFLLPITIFVKSKGVMISKEELRKHSKDELVNLTYDLFLKVDKLTSEVQELREEVKILKTPKNSGNSSLPPSHDLFHLLMTCSDLRTKAFGKTATKKQVGKPVTREKHY